MDPPRDHQVINHADEYVGGLVHTDGIEKFLVAVEA